MPKQGLVWKEKTEVGITQMNYSLDNFIFLALKKQELYIGTPPDEFQL